MLTTLRCPINLQCRVINAQYHTHNIFSAGAWPLVRMLSKLRWSMTRIPPGLMMSRKLDSATFWLCSKPSKSGRWANELPKHTTASNPPSGISSTSLRSSERDNQFAFSITETPCFFTSKLITVHNYILGKRKTPFRSVVRQCKIKTAQTHSRAHSRTHAHTHTHTHRHAQRRDPDDRTHIHICVPNHRPTSVVHKLQYNNFAINTGSTSQESLHSGHPVQR